MRLKWALFGLLLAMSLALAALWAFSFYRPGAWVVSVGASTLSLDNSRGRIAVTMFSKLPEDETYRNFAVPCWAMESVVLCATLWMGWRVFKDRQTKNARGFPV